MEALLGLLPFVLYALLCPLMMLFMHGGRGHGGHEHDGAHQHDDPAGQPRASVQPPSDKALP